jgi:hypothetical protein
MRLSFLETLFGFPFTTCCLRCKTVWYCSHYLHQRHGTSGKFTSGVIDSSGKFSTSVVDTGGAPWHVNISANFRKNLRPYCNVIFRGLVEDDSWKNVKLKISWHCPSNSQDIQSVDAARLGVGTAGIITPVSVHASIAVLLDSEQRSGRGRYWHNKRRRIISIVTLHIHE